MKSRITISIIAIAAMLSSFAAYSSSGQTKGDAPPAQRRIAIQRSGIINRGPGQFLRLVAVNTGDAPVRVKLGMVNYSIANYQNSVSLVPTVPQSTNVIVLAPGRGVFLDSQANFPADYGTRVVVQEERQQGSKSSGVRYSLAVVEQDGRTISLGGQELELGGQELELGGQDFE